MAGKTTKYKLYQVVTTAVPLKGEGGVSVPVKTRMRVLSPITSGPNKGKVRARVEDADHENLEGLRVVADAAAFSVTQAGRPTPAK